MANILKNKPTFCTTYDGRKIRIADMQKSLNDFPSVCRKVLDDFGEPGLTNCVTNLHKCGCEIEGNGTLQFPLRIKFCEKHSY